MHTPEDCAEKKRETSTYLSNHPKEIFTSMISITFRCQNCIDNFVQRASLVGTCMSNRTQQFPAKRYIWKVKLLAIKVLVLCLANKLFGQKFFPITNLFTSSNLEKQINYTTWPEMSRTKIPPDFLSEPGQVFARTRRGRTVGYLRYSRRRLTTSRLVNWIYAPVKFNQYQQPQY